MEKETEEVQFTIDASEEVGFLSFFRQLPEKPSTTIRFFDHTDYYTCHGSDALFAAGELFNTEAVIKYMKSGKSRLEYVTMSKMNFEAFLRDLLLVRQYRVEMFINEGTKSNPNWKLGAQGSPGNLFEFEDVLFGANCSQSSSTLVAAVKCSVVQGQKTVGLALVDPGSRRMHVTEFPDNDTFSSLEATLVQLDPKECLIAAGESSDNAAPDAKVKSGRVSSIAQVAERGNILVTELKKSDFTGKDVVQDLNRLLKFPKGVHHDAGVLPEAKKEVAMAALGAVIKFLKLMNDNGNFGTFRLQSLDSSRWMRLDAAAVKALNVMPLGNEVSRNESLLGILNLCKTPQGQRYLRQCIRQPLTDVNKIEERLDIVDNLVKDVALKVNLREDYLKKIPDFQRLKKRFIAQNANLAEYYKVYACIKSLPSLLCALEGTSGDHVDTLSAVFVQPLQVHLRSMDKFAQMIEYSVDVDRAAAGEFVVRAGISEELDEIRDEVKRLEKDMKKNFEIVAKDLNLEVNKTLKLECNDQLGYFYRVTKKEEKVLRNNSKYKMIDANKSGVRFHSGELKRLNVEYVELRKNYQAAETSVLREIAEVAVTYVDSMQNINDVIAELDMMVAFAAAATGAPAPYVRPQILPAEEGVLVLRNARHPCLELQDGVAFIPNSAEFKKDGKKFWIITGPNMGGKSTYIRSVGCCVLMAQIGSFVPCDEAVVSVRDGILARVGAGDDASRGVSTFMAEMLDTAAILRAATEHSLIIIDELGRGTSTYDGFGLAWAISENIASKIGAFCLFATHFHELMALEDDDDSVGNLHVAATTADNQLTLLYEVKPGVCDQSFGIHVAEMARFPPEVVSEAKKKLAILEDFSSDVIAGTELEGTEPSAVRKRKESKEAGRKMIADALAQVKLWKEQGRSDEDIFARIQDLKARVNNNLYVKDLLTRHGVAI